MPGLYTEADYENSVIELFRNMEYNYLYGPDIERDVHNPLYEEELVASLYRLNRSLPEDAISDALFKLKNFENGKTLSLWIICKTAFLCAILKKARNAPPSSILLTIKIPTTTPLS